MSLPRDVAASGPRPRSIADDQPQSDLQLALGHAMWRNNLVAKVFCYLSVMRAADLIPAGAKVLISPADLPVPQDFHAKGGNEAAHYLPGFVAIQTNGTPRGIWELVPYPQARAAVESLFRQTQDLKPSFNRADSAAEIRRKAGPKGLKQLFGQCCQTVVDQLPPRSRYSGEVFIVVDRPLMRRVFRQWAEGSMEAYRHAATGKSGAIKTKMPSDVRTEPHTDLTRGIFREWTAADLDARVRDQQRVVHGRKGTVEEFSDQESFLRAYANVTSGEFPLSESIVHEIEAPFSVRR